MKTAVLEATTEADILLMAAAVGDYRPATLAPQKIKKGADLTLQLERTPDILNAVAARRAESGYPRQVVGFAAESENLLENARTKITNKHLDLIVANDVTSPEAGFATETNRVVILNKHGGIEELPLMSKASVAEAILDRLLLPSPVRGSP
jgi:phosphopantothenoylcysteine decarboxylase/phosphopantothenate--cysteine ligase